MVVCLERDLCLSYTLHTLTFSMRTNSVLTPCKVRYFHVTTIPSVLSRYYDSLGTFTLLRFPRYFHVTPLALGTKFPMKLQGARTQSSPRNITHREGSLLQIAAF